MDTAAILQKIAAGSRKAEKALFQQMADNMLFVCLRYVPNRVDAEELMLNGWLKLFKHLPGFIYEHEAGFYAWARRIMINECLMFIRKQHSFLIVGEPAEDCLLHTPDLDAKIDAALLFEEIRLLPVGYRTVFNLHIIEGYEHQEIADLLQISLGTSKSQLSKARQLLQKNLRLKGIAYASRKTV